MIQCFPLPSDDLSYRRIQEFRKRRVLGFLPYLQRMYALERHVSYLGIKIDEC